MERVEGQRKRGMKRERETKRESVVEIGRERESKE
jgi:hypothetical protein